MSKGFKPVTKAAPCPACGKPDWCAWTDDGTLKCERVTEPPNGMRLVKLIDGGAYFAPLIQNGVTHRRGPKPRNGRIGRTGANGPTAEGPPTPKFHELTAQFSQALAAEQRTDLASQLGVTETALVALGAGWVSKTQLQSMGASGQGWKDEYPDGAFCFPERDGGGKCIGFSLRARDGRKGGPSKAAGAGRGLIVPTTFAAMTGTVLIVEGASDVAACVTLGLRAVGRPSNAGGTDHLDRLLAGLNVLVVGERDQKEGGQWPGRDGATKVAGGLAGRWDNPVKWALPPGSHKDVRAWLLQKVASSLDLTDENATKAAGQELLGLLTSEARVEGPPPTPKQAEKLVCLALENHRLGITDAGEPFIVPFEGPNVCTLFREGREKLRATLSKDYRKRYGSIPSSTAISDAITNLEGEAHDCAQEPVHLRLAQHGEQIVLDLGTKKGEAAVVSPGGWEVVDRSPVLFRRTVLTGPLPIPERAGSLNELRELLNIDDATWPLVMGWLVAALIPGIPHPILFFGGEQGTGKTTAGRMLLRLFDPSPAPLRTPPRNEQEWAVTTSASWGILVDNISTIAAWWSDALCKVVTGDGWLGRTLYTSTGVTVLTFRRVVMFTSIDAGALKGDLGDRLLLVDLQVIPDAQRRTDNDLERVFVERQPRVVGGLLTLLSKVMERLPHVRLEGMPRMADFAVVLAAMDEVLGTCSLETYLGQRGRIAADVVEGDSVSAAIAAKFPSEESWSGNARALLERITPQTPPNDWPKSATAFARRLRRLVPALRTIGIDVTIPEPTDKRRLYVVFRNALNARPPETPLPDSAAAGSAWAFGAKSVPVRPSERPGKNGSVDPADAEPGRSGVQGVRSQPLTSPGPGVAAAGVLVMVETRKPGERFDGEPDWDLPPTAPPRSGGRP